MAETSLYLPVKQFLEAQGYVVKSEVKSCDVVGLRGQEPPVIVELKTGFTLQLVFQAMDRLTMTDHVYLAITRPKRGIAADALKLCRRIGVGLIVVAASGSLEVLADPVPYAPRKNAKRTTHLLREFTRRQGDPNTGGSTRKPIMTAYRQQALACAVALSQAPARPRDLKTLAPDAPKILQGNVYGWFERVERGVYGLSEGGRAALVLWADALPAPRP